MNTTKHVLDFIPWLMALRNIYKMKNLIILFYNVITFLLLLEVVSTEVDRLHITIPKHVVVGVFIPVFNYGCLGIRGNNVSASNKLFYVRKLGMTEK